MVVMLVLRSCCWRKMPKVNGQCCRSRAMGRRDDGIRIEGVIVDEDSTNKEKFQPAILEQLGGLMVDGTKFSMKL